MPPLKNPNVFLCDGCSKVAGWNCTGWICSVYENPFKTFAIRTAGICPFNLPFKTTRKRDKIRVGQQKSKRLGK